MDQKTRQLRTIHKALHPRDDIDRLYVLRKEGGRGLSSIEDNTDTSVQRYEDYIEKSAGRLITVTRSDTDSSKTNRMTITRKQKWEEKQFYGRFKRLINNISQENLNVAKKRKTLKDKQNLS